ncbi:hybrid sensor histidine kinase/response regulator [Blastopirellula marina]|uniref:histidine kinase n=1 Tax=Blastopirellula marina DSM 3645 TaxID=314230 RepID=A4A0F5_9BACT|nr:hybrid sensor histidine kinase/response regulator [Blastopirellula marina]EAQ77775.1 response regulator/sensor histidine kinase [Blastopirellula marina DSM 3645]
MTDSPPSPVYCLTVDDREENLLALEVVLRREGLELIKARSGPEALEALLQHDVALALIDVQMPIMDGFELAELMRGTERTKRVPIIFLTAGTEDHQRRFRGYEAGAVDFLHKPIESDILKSKAEVFFELFRQRQEVARQRDELKVLLHENSRLLEQSRKQSETLQNSDRRKNEFLATLAHELRNPLAPILSAVEVIRLSELSKEEEIEVYDIVKRQVQHMVRLIDDLLDISRISRDKIQLRREIFQLGDVVKNAVETSTPLIAEANHQLSVKQPSAPIEIFGDAVRISQVIANLLNNAAKYTPDGGRIELSVALQEGLVAISVKDNGIGIPPELLSEVFEMFNQVDKHLDLSKGGLGIGLTLVKRLVEMHGGKIDVISAGEGEGSEFIVRLPISKSQDRHQQPSSSTNAV